MVENTGFEPMSFRQLTDALPTEPYNPKRISGEYRVRTGDLLVANQALSQLS